MNLTGSWRCPVCKQQFKTPAGAAVRVKHECPGQTPSLAQKALNYQQAVSRWMTAGCPTRSEVEVAKLLETCQTCDWHKDGVCVPCGCKVNLGEFPLSNKLKMATEVCPLGKWK